MSILTRASTKLVIVHNSGNNIDDTNAEEQAYKLKVTEQLTRTLNNYLEEKLLLIGVIHDYMQFEDITSQRFEDPCTSNQISHPKVEGLRLLSRSRVMKYFQIDDINRKEDMEELQRNGVEKVILVGDIENFHLMSRAYSWHICSTLSAVT